jgi:hypothetical protein
LSAAALAVSLAHLSAFADGTVSISLLSSRDGQTVAPGTTIDWTVKAEVSNGDNLGLALLAVDLVRESGPAPSVDLLPGTADPAMADFERPRGVCNPLGLGGTPVGPPGSGILLQIGGAQNTFGVAGVGIGEDVVVDGGIGQAAGGQVIATGSFLAPEIEGDYVFALQNGVATVLTEINPAPLQSSVALAAVTLAAPTFSFTVAGGLIGDLDGNGCVDQSDLGVLLADFDCQLPGPCPGDVDGDGDTDQGDLGAMLANFGLGPNCP